MDSLFKSLNPTKTLNDSIPTLIDVFCMFYGEDKREYITEKFHHVVLIGVQKVDTMNSIIINIKNNKSRELIEKVFREYGIDLTEENINKYIGYSSSLEYPNSFGMIRIYQFIDEVLIGSEGRRKREEEKRYLLFKNFIPNLTMEDFLNKNISNDDLKKLPNYIRMQLDLYYDYEDVEEKYLRDRKEITPLIHEIMPEVTEDNVESMIKMGRLDKLKTIGHRFLQASEEFREFFVKEVKPYSDLYDKLHECQNSIERKYFIEYLKEFMDVLTEEDRNTILEKIEKKDRFFFGVDGLNFLSSSFIGVANISYFSSSKDDELENPGVSDYRKEQIKKNRIAFFKYKGIDLGDNYEAYVSSQECQAIWPSQELVSRIIDRRDYYHHQANIEFYTQLDFYKEQTRKIEELGLLDKEEYLQPSAFSLSQTQVSTNIVQKDGKYQYYPIILIYASGLPEADVRLIHELNHFYELTLLEANDKHYKGVCGWDYVSGDINQENVEFEDTVHDTHVRRNHEWLSEIVNELIAQKITKMMHDNGIYIFGEEGKTRDSGGTSYERSLFLIREFFDTYFEDIIASRRDNNIEIIWNKVGKENMELLNDLFNEFYSTFTEGEFMGVFEDIKNGNNTERVQKYELLKSKRDQLLAKMREYSLNSKVSL